MPAHYASADEPTLRQGAWLEQQWDLARLKARETSAGALLVLDEIQKVPGWSGAVKLLWDADTHARLPLKVVLLGSSPLLVQSGLTESLAGRFEIIPVPHWSFTEMRAAFGWNLDQFIFYGAYPGAAPLIAEPERWRRYIVDALIETTISRDILLLTRVDKPALLRQMFQLGCDYSGQILAYQKMLGQLHDAGNTVTLAHYLHLLRGAGMVAGLSKYSHGQVRQRGSSPKLQVLNTALMTAQAGRTFTEARQDGNHWGRLVESSVRGCAPAELQHGQRLGSDLLAGPQSGGGFCIAPGQASRGFGGEKWSGEGFAARDGSIRAPVQATAATAGRWPGHPSGGVLVQACRTLGAMIACNGAGGCWRRCRGWIAKPVIRGWPVIWAA